MTKFLANLFLLIAGIAVMLGNYWFTFGLWPKSWTSFFGFGFATIILMLMRFGLDKEK